ncbi:MAG: polysulfide reductase NrfD [Chloroflexi bacterium]|nr:polysulfide reductase NrfD [Chloroflexota bacterium]
MAQQIATQPFEWMVKHTRQTEWIEKWGTFLWLALFWGIGAGVYLIGVFFDSLAAMFVGWLILFVGKGGFHMLFIAKNMRFMRAMNVFLTPRTFKTSWISRGLFFIMLFGVFGAAGLAVRYWAPDSGAALPLEIIAGIFAFAAALYTGFVLSFVRGIPFWNNSLLPVIYVLSSLEGGAAIGVAMGAYSNVGIDAVALEEALRVMLTVFAFMLGVYLWNARYGGSTSKLSVTALTRGPAAFSLPFWLGLVVLGIVVPMVLAWTPVSEELSPPVIILATVCSFISGLSLRYSLLKSGFYKPLIPLT